MPNNDYQSLQRYLKIKGWVEETFVKKGSYGSVNILPSYADFPSIGNENDIYIALDTSLMYIFLGDPDFRYKGLEVNFIDCGGAAEEV